MTRRTRSDFERFYAESKDQCFRAVLATVGVADEADDLVAEAYTRAFAKWKTVVAHPAPKAWVVRTALNLHRDRWRTSQRRDRYLRRHVDGFAYIDAVDPGLIDAVRSLPERQREAVVFRVLLGLSAEQAGTELGIEPGTVGTHLRRGLAALRIALAPTAETHHIQETTP